MLVLRMATDTRVFGWPLADPPSVQANSIPTSGAKRPFLADAPFGRRGAVDAAGLRSNQTDDVWMQEGRAFSPCSKHAGQTHGKVPIGQEVPQPCERRKKPAPWAGNGLGSEDGPSALISCPPSVSQVAVKWDISVERGVRA